MNPRTQILKDLADARSRLGPQWHAAASSLSPSRFLHTSLQKHRLAWAAGAVVTGFLAVRLLLPSSRRKNERDTSGKSAKKSGFLALIASPFFGMARKAVLSFATRQLQLYLQNSVKHPRQP